jgi:hypothetical protein
MFLLEKSTRSDLRAVTGCIFCLGIVVSHLPIRRGRMIYVFEAKDSAFQPVSFVYPLTVSVPRQLFWSESRA